MSNWRSDERKKKQGLVGRKEGRKCITNKSMDNGSKKMKERNKMSKRKEGKNKER